MVVSRRSLETADAELSLGRSSVRSLDDVMDTSDVYDEWADAAAPQPHTPQGEADRSHKKPHRQWVELRTAELQEVSTESNGGIERKLER